MIADRHDLPESRRAEAPTFGHCETAIGVPAYGMTEEQPQIVATDTLFYHEADEEAFFGWIDRMTFVRETYGVGKDMFLIFSRFPTEDDMWEIIGFCRRYGIDMSQLAKFETKENTAWMRDSAKVWCNEIFGVLENANGS